MLDEWLWAINCCWDKEKQGQDPDSYSILSGQL